MPPKTTNAQLKRNVGATVHAPAHLVLGDKTAKKYFGNKRWNSHYLRGVVVSSTDGKTKPDDWAQWTLNVNFDIVETDGTLREVTNYQTIASSARSLMAQTILLWFSRERTVVIPTEASVIQPQQTAPPLPLLLL